MKNLKVIEVTSDMLRFDNGMKLYSEHCQSCCESHYLNLSDLKLSDFEGLEFDLSNYTFFEGIDGYGIALNPINGHPVRIPAYAENNGYYSSDLELVLENSDGSIYKKYDITEFQKYDV